MPPGTHQRVCPTAWARAGRGIRGGRRGGPADVAAADQGRHVEVLGQHDQRQLTGRQLHLQIARPPAFGRHVDIAAHVDFVMVGCTALDYEVALAQAVLRPLLHAERIAAGLELQDRASVEHELGAASRQAGNRHGAATCVPQFDAYGRRFLGLRVLHGKLQLAVGRLELRGNTTCDGRHKGRTGEQPARGKLVGQTSPAAGHRSVGGGGWDSAGLSSLPPRRLDDANKSNVECLGGIAAVDRTAEPLLRRGRIAEHGRPGASFPVGRFGSLSRSALSLPRPGSLGSPRSVRTEHLLACEV